MDEEKKEGQLPPPQKPKKVEGEITVTVGSKSVTMPLPKEKKDNK